MAQQSLPDFESAPKTDNGARGKKKRRTGVLKVHDPFELIRWLALSQPDPRKALAELVQNSLDAGASRIEIVRVRKKKAPTLIVRDDGEGVIPELSREDALRYLATHIGHSRKRKLTPRERLDLMTQGQYGIGLLGFWSLGETLEMRTFVPGEKPLRLILERDKPNFRIEGIRGPVSEEGRATEVLVHDLHAQAIPLLGARRITGFLASELRGQLLGRDVTVTVRDRMARGRAPKRLVVEPQRYSGHRVDGLRELPVPGFPAATLDLYLDPAGSKEPLSLYAGGTLVAERFTELGGIDLDRAPWTDRRLAGAIDFSALTVAPGSRRGVVPDKAAAALRKALEKLAPRVAHLLELENERRLEELDRATVRNLQRAYRDLYRRLPRYELLPVDRGKRSGPGAEGAAPPGLAAEIAEEATEAATGADDLGSVDVGSIETPVVEEHRSGPLESVEITPDPVKVLAGRSRWVRARPLDAEGRLVDGRCDYLWRAVGVRADVENQPGMSPRARVVAGDRPGRGALRVLVQQEERAATIEVPLEIEADASGEEAGKLGEGVPEPELVADPHGSWRSRFEDQRWQVNSSHPGYVAAAASPSLLLRYLALLFAKEVVLHSSRDPRLEQPLEELAEVFGFADRQLTLGSRSKDKS